MHLQSWCFAHLILYCSDLLPFPFTLPSLSSLFQHPAKLSVCLNVQRRVSGQEEREPEYEFF